MKKLLFSRADKCIAPLRELVEAQDHKTIIMWAQDFATQFLDIFESRNPDDKRPREALKAAALWAEGKIKMPTAKKAILDTHKAAKTYDPISETAARAVAHAAATVHVETHALESVFYGLSCIALLQGADDCDRDELEKIVKKDLNEIYKKLVFWQKNIDTVRKDWAEFVTKEKPNKEKVLHDKELAKSKR